MAKEIGKIESSQESIGQITKYSSIEAGLAELKERHFNVVIDVSSPSGMAAAKAGRAEIKRVRLNLEDARVEEKAESLAYGKLVDSEANRIKAILEPMETAYDRAIKAEEQRKENERMEILKEQQRLAKEEADRIQAEKDRVAAEEKRKLQEAEERLAEMERLFEIKQKEAADALAKIETDRKAAQDKIDQEERERKAKIEAEEKASRDRIELAERESRLRVENEQRKLREIEDEKARVIKAAADKLESEARIVKETEARLAREKAEKIALIEREKQAKIEEKKRQEQLKKQLRLDGVSMLRVFNEKYGSDIEFEGVTQEIKKYLSGIK